MSKPERFLQVITHWDHSTHSSREKPFLKNALSTATWQSSSYQLSCEWKRGPAQPSAQLHVPVSVPENQRRMAVALLHCAPLHFLSRGFTESGARPPASNFLVSGTHRPGIIGFLHGHHGFEARPSCLCTTCAHPLNSLARFPNLDSVTAFFHILLHSKNNGRKQPPAITCMPVPRVPDHILLS